MKNDSRDGQNIRKPQYTSKILVQQNPNIDKHNQKVIYTRRGVSSDPSKDRNQGVSRRIPDSEQVGLSSLITQSPREGRPVTSSNTNSNQSSAINSPRPNTERVGYSSSPNKLKNLVKYLPPKSRAYLNKKTLVLDLDETLVHSAFRPFSVPSDILLKIELEKKIHDIHVLVRPGVDEFLERMSKHYELVIFTASLSKYADPLMDKLDPKRLCAYRLFREHCTMINNAFVKDLKRLDRDLKDIIILDNSPISYALNPENGFPTKSWYEDKSDKELYNIANALEFIAYVPDVRDFIKKMVDKNEFSYSKALSIINSYQPNLKEENYHKQQNERESSTRRVPSSSQIIQQDMLSVQSNNKDRDSSKISAGTSRYLAANAEPAKPRELENKQINIKIVNNNFTHYFLNPQDNITSEPKKQQKNINTFRSSNAPTQYTNYIEVNKNNSQISIKDEISKTPNYIYQKNSTPSNNYLSSNTKNSIQINLSQSRTELKSPVLRNTPQKINHSVHNQVYSSLIDKSKESKTSLTRPGTANAIAVKSKHVRDLSLNANPSKLDQNIVPFGNSAVYRSPSSQSIVNTLNRNYKQNPIKRETQRAYIREYDTSRHLNISSGHNTVRPSSHHDRSKINFTPVHSISQNIKSPINRYTPDEVIDRRGYSLSSRAVDNRHGYRFRDNEVKYSTQSKINLTSSGGKFSASGIYRPSSQKK